MLARSLTCLHGVQLAGLFFCGEVLDIDGITGGYNLQSAWTTGTIAGKSIAELVGNI